MLQVVSIGVLLSSDVQLSVLFLVVLVGGGVVCSFGSSFNIAVSGALVAGGDEAGEGPLPVVLASRPSLSRAGWWCSGGLWWGWQWGGRGPSPHHSTRQAQVLVN